MGKLFFLGDSITAGAWDTEGGWVERVSKELMRIRAEIPARCAGKETRQIVCAVGIKDSVHLTEEKEGFLVKLNLKTILSKLSKMG